MSVEEDVVLAVEIADLLGAEIATVVVDSVIFRENEKNRKADTNKIVLYTKRPSVDQTLGLFLYMNTSNIDVIPHLSSAAVWPRIRRPQQKRRHSKTQCYLASEF